MVFSGRLWRSWLSLVKDIRGEEGLVISKFVRNARQHIFHELFEFSLSWPYSSYVNTFLVKILSVCYILTEISLGKKLIWCRTKLHMHVSGSIVVISVACRKKLGAISSVWGLVNLPQQQKNIVDLYCFAHREAQKFTRQQQLCFSLPHFLGHFLGCL